MSRYSLSERAVYFACPDPDDPVGRAQLAFLLPQLGFASLDELLDLLEILTPRLIAHELGHHLRHRYGLFGPDLWLEEQIANQFAVALTKQALSPKERGRCVELARRVLNTISDKDVSAALTDSYYSLHHALNVTGQLPDAALEQLEVMQHLFALSPEESLLCSGQIDPEFTRRIEQRNQVIEEINENYASNLSRYILYHLGWLIFDLTSRENQYVEELAAQHLARVTQFLPSIKHPPGESVSTISIHACHEAHRECERVGNAVASRYFYQRYRGLLLTKLADDGLSSASQTQQFQHRVAYFLGADHDVKNDPLNFIESLARIDLQPFFPLRIASLDHSTIALRRNLPEQSDLRIWRAAVLKEEDEAAQNTLDLLALLYQTKLCRSLPARIHLDLARFLYLIHLDKGEVLIWEGDTNNDIFILLEGGLEVEVASADGIPKHVGKITPGEVFGEIEFVAPSGRSATVRAMSRVTCFVLKATPFRVFATRHPSVLMNIAHVLAKRVRTLNAELANGAS